MFTTLISGLPGIIIPLLFSSLTTFLIALCASLDDLAPVQTIFPVLKIRIEVLGLLIL